MDGEGVQTMSFKKKAVHTAVINTNFARLSPVRGSSFFFENDCLG